MPVRSAGFSCSLVALALLLAPGLSPAADGPIVKPRDGTWIPGNVLEVIAKASEARLLIDGEPVQVEEPFPGVLHARVEVTPGRHLLRLASSSGLQEVVVHTGEAPDGDSSPPYVDHPPVPMECAFCHSVSRRGRFRFSGGCQNCHSERQFVETHSHQFHELARCGMCHDAHGSAASKLLLLPEEQACRQCHN